MKDNRLSKRVTQGKPRGRNVEGPGKAGKSAVGTSSNGLNLDNVEEYEMCFIKKEIISYSFFFKK